MDQVYTGTLQLDGQLLANALPHANCNPGGSGGSIYVALEL
jgi:hypothetical protein